MSSMDIAQLPFEVAALIGRTEIPMRAYLGLQVGDIVLLEQKIEEPLSIQVGGETRYLGRPGLSETRKAVTIHERIHTRRD